MPLDAISAASRPRRNSSGGAGRFDFHICSIFQRRKIAGALARGCGRAYAFGHGAT
jgi:hypothetical protein